MTYSLVNPQDLVTSDLAYQVVASPEFKRLFESEVLAAIEFVKMAPQIIEAIRPFRKIPELNPLFRNLPPSDEIHIDYSLLDTISPGEFINLALVRAKASITGEFWTPPFEAAF